MQSANVVRLIAAVCALTCSHTYSATITTTTTTTAAPPNITSTTTTTTKAPLATLEAEVDVDEEDNEAAPAGSSVQIAPWQQQLSPAPYPPPSTPAAHFPPPPPPPSTPAAPASSDVEIVRSVELDFVFDNDRNGSVSRPYGPPVNQTLTAAASAFRPGTPVAFSARDVVLDASAPGPATVHDHGGGAKASRPRRRTVAAPAPEDFRLESRSLLGPVLLRRSDAFYVAPAPRRTARLRTTLETATRGEADNPSPHGNGETATRGEADNPSPHGKGETATRGEATNSGDLAGTPESSTRGTTRHPSGRAPPKDSAAGETSLNPRDRARSPGEGETSTRGAATNARDRTRPHGAADTPTRAPNPTGRSRHPNDPGASETATRGSTRNPTSAATAPSVASEDQAEASQELPFGAKTERGAVKFRPTEPPVDGASPNHNDPGEPQRIVVTPVYPQRHTPFRHHVPTAGDERHTPIRHAHEVAAGPYSSVSSQSGHEVGGVGKDTKGHSSVSIQHGHEIGGVGEDVAGPHIVVTPVHPRRPQAGRHTPIRHGHELQGVGEDAGHSSVSIQHGHANTPIRHGHEVGGVNQDAGGHSSVSIQRGQVDTLPFAPADVRLQPNPLGPAQVIFIQPYAPPPPPRPAHPDLPTPPVLDTHQWVPVYVQEAYAPFLLQHHLPQHHHQHLRLEEHHRHPDEAWSWATHQDSTSSIPNESTSDNKFF